jgi:hypothetical protein
LLQAVGQLIPTGLLETLPVPVPVVSMVVVKAKTNGGVGLKFAVTFLSAFMVTVQVVVPVQSPDQPTKIEPLMAGMAFKITTVF